jgi:H+/gluconate symporter-like permease
LVAGIDRPAKGVYWATATATATAVIFMVVPPDPPAHANALWYVRENAYVIATLVLFALIALLWLRHRRQDSPEAAVQADGRTTSVASASRALGG